MIVKIELSGSASASIRYFTMNSTSKFLYSSLGNDNPTEQVKLLNEVSTWASRSDMKNKFIHVSISFNPNDQLDEAKMTRITRQCINKMFGDVGPLYYCSYLHQDKSHSHTHSLICRISHEKNVQNDINYFLVQQMARNFERAFGLIITKAEKSEKRRTTKIAHAEKYEYTNVISHLWKKLDDALESSRSSTEFVEKLNKDDITCRLRKDNESYVGISYSITLIHPLPKFSESKGPRRNPNIFIINGSKLGHKYTIQNILQRIENNKINSNEANAGIRKQIEDIVSAKSDFYDMILKFKSLGLDFELENKKIVFVKESANERLRIDDLTPHLARLFERLLLDFINNHKKENQPKKKRSLQNELSKNSKIKDQEKLGYEL